MITENHVSRNKNRMYRYGSKKRISVFKNIFRSLEKGSSRNQACRYAGIEYRTLWEWMQKDARLKAKIEDPSNDKIKSTLDKMGD